ncbi:hypothetical protein AB0J63_17145 [Streptosporangium canum]|uniref:hypothetical protein n=1 Tax=Streptosporangium canum TaxID=324952 RepID=UPI0034331F1D
MIEQGKQSALVAGGLSLSGTAPGRIAQMPRRNGWSHQVPAKRALERDQDAVTG